MHFDRAPRSVTLAEGRWLALTVPLGLLGVFGAALLIEQHRGFQWNKHERVLIEGRVKQYLLSPRLIQRHRWVGYLLLATAAVFIVFDKLDFVTSVNLGGGLLLLVRARWYRSRPVLLLLDDAFVYGPGLFSPRQIIRYEDIAEINVRAR
jgi:hypothetical protein